MPDVRLAVVILNYRTPGLVMDCLETLVGEVDPARDRVMVVDNASGDGSAEVIDEGIRSMGYGSWATLVRSPTNGGFSAGNNVGIRSVDAEYYMLLNSDTLVRPGAIAELLRAAARHPEAGLIGPRLEWPDATPQISCFRSPSVPSQLIESAQTGFITAALSRFDVAIGVPDGPTDAAWVSFACVLIPGSVVERVGLMDEGFFMYFEDAEYGQRVRRAGLRVLHWPAARVVHLRGGSSDVKSATKQRKRVAVYFYRARARYFALRGGRARLMLANVAWTAGWLIALARYLVQRRPIGTARQAARDIWAGFWRPLEPFRPNGGAG